MKKHLLKSVLTLAMLLGGMNVMALESYDFQELCMALGKGGPWAVNDGGDAGFTIGDATMHLLGDYTDQGFSWNKRFAYEYVEGRGKFTMRNKNNKKDTNCGMFSWDYAHYFSILDLKDGDKVTITIPTGTVTFVSETAEGVSEGSKVESNKTYTIATTDESTRLDIQMEKATLIAKIVIEPAGVESVPVITLDRKTLKLIPGATAKLVATIDPLGVETQWKSSDESVATVAKDGIVTAIKGGTATISNNWASTVSDKTASAACELAVADVDLAQYSVVKAYDFTTMGDVMLELSSEAAGAIWNEANTKNNNVFFCTNEGLEEIAVQAAVANNKGWSIVDGQGLFLASGAGRCAAIGGIKTGQIVEIFYTGDGFYTRSDDDGIEKTALNEGLGRAIYQADEDGMLGFELIKGNAVTKVNIYEQAAEAPALENIAAMRDYMPTESGVVSVKLDNVKVTYTGVTEDSWGTNDIIIMEDASAGNAFQNTTLGTQLKAGQVLNGILKLNVEVDELYGDILYSTDESSLAEVEITDGELSPLEVTDDNVMEYLGDYSWRLAKFTNAAVSVETGTYGDDVYVAIPVLGGDPIGMQDTFGIIPEDSWPKDGDLVDIEGYYVSYSIYGSTIQYIQPLSIKVLPKPYEFVASEWIAGDAGRISPEKVVADTEANTITVSQTGQNNVALLFRSSTVYTVKAEQRYFVIKGTGLSTAAGASYLWWLNNDNRGTQIEPTSIYEEDGQTVLAWDCATIAIGLQLGIQDTEFKDEGGWSTTFGLTLADENVPAVISYIGFEEAIENPVEEFEYEFVASEWPAGDSNRISSSQVVVDETANTITVSATGDNNVALVFKTDKIYYLPEPVKYFVIQATGLSTEEGKSKLWWLNAKNNGGEVLPTQIVSGDVTTFIWDITADATFASGFNTEGKTYLDGTGASTWGWTTTFGLTLADPSVPAVFSYIGYETEDSPVVTAISSASMKPATSGIIYNLQGQRVEKAAKGLYIIDGKKVMVK